MAEQIFVALTTFLPYRLIGYYPFWNRLRLPKRIVLTLILTTEAGVQLLKYMVDANGGNSRFVDLMMFPLCIAIYFSCVRLEPSKLAFFYLFLTDYMGAVRGLTAFITARWFPEAGMSSWVGGLIHLALFTSMLPIIIRLWRGTVNRMLEVRSPELWRTIWIAPAFSTLVILRYTFHMDSAHAGNFTFLFSRVGAFTCIFVVYHILLRSLDTIRAQAILEEQARAGGELLALQRRQYELLAKRIEDMRTARHDLRQHLKLIQSYLASGDKDALADYVAAYGQTLPAEAVEPFCRNPAVNAIAAYYGEQAKSQGVAFDARLDLPPQLPLPEPDFCVVMGNLLENALDALGTNKPGAFLKIRASLKDGKELILTVDNGPVAEPVVRGGQLLSSKHEGAGIGTVSVKRVAAHYNGVADFSWRDGVFYASVYLRPVPEESAPAGTGEFPVR